MITLMEWSPYIVVALLVGLAVWLLIGRRIRRWLKGEKPAATGGCANCSGCPSYYRCAQTQKRGDKL